MKEVIIKEQNGNLLRARLITNSGERTLQIKTFNRDWVDLSPTEHSIAQYIQELMIIEHWLRENDKQCK